MRGTEKGEWRDLVMQSIPGAIMPEMDRNNEHVSQTADLMSQISVILLSAEAMKLCKTLVASRTAFSWQRVNSSYHSVVYLPSVQWLQYRAKKMVVWTVFQALKKKISGLVVKCARWYKTSRNSWCYLLCASVKSGLQGGGTKWMLVSFENSALKYVSTWLIKRNTFSFSTLRVQTPAVEL